MANLTETPVWRTGVFQLELSTPVRGGPAGESNVPLLNLADRTAYLKQEVDAILAAIALLAPIASPDFTGTPLATTPSLDDDSRRIVTTEWVRDFLGSVTTVNTTGGNTALTATQAARGIIVVTGALTSNATLILPSGSIGRWTIFNQTTGAYTVSARLSGTTIHAISQNAMRTFWAEGTTLRPGLSEAVDLALLGTPTAPTAAASVNTTQVATTAYARRFARGTTSKTATGGGTITLSDTEAAAPVILLTGSPASAFTVVFPSEGARWEVRNATGQAATLKTSAQTGGVILGGGYSTTVFADGTIQSMGSPAMRSLAASFSASRRMPMRSPRRRPRSRAHTPSNCPMRSSDSVGLRIERMARASPAWLRRTRSPTLSSPIPPPPRRGSTFPRGSVAAADSERSEESVIPVGGDGDVEPSLLTAFGGASIPSPKGGFGEGFELSLTPLSSGPVNRDASPRTPRTYSSRTMREENQIGPGERSTSVTGSPLRRPLRGT